MQRVNRVSEVARKENPPTMTGGLSEQCNGPRESEEFASAFRLISQAREVVAETAKAWSEFDRGRNVQSVADWEVHAFRREMREARVIYQALHIGEIRRDFEKIFGVDLETFEVSLLELEHRFGRPS